MKKIVFLTALFLISILFLIPLQLAIAAKFIQSARVDVKIGNPPSCVFNLEPVLDTETPCGWPTTGHLTYLPFQPGTTHESLSAIDIASDDFAAGEPVYASHDGVANVVIEDEPPADFPDNPPERKVILRSPKYTTKYQHLLQPCVADGVNVTRGTLIGLMDNSGYSDGHHLHYDITKPDGAALSLEEFNQVVPPYSAGDNVKASYSGGTCPVLL